MTDAVTPQHDVTALILAGGAGRRMGGVDKGLLPLDGKPLVQYVIDAIAPQVAGIIISANRNLDAYRRFGYPVIEDRLPGNPGPLAGIAQGLLTAETRFLLTIPCDAPWVAPDLAVRMCGAMDSQPVQVAIAHDGERLQPAHLLLGSDLSDEVDGALAAGERKVRSWVLALAHVEVDFADRRECFANINAPSDLERFNHPEDIDAPG